MSLPLARFLKWGVPLLDLPAFAVPHPAPSYCGLSGPHIAVPLAAPCLAPSRRRRHIYGRWHPRFPKRREHRVAHGPRRVGAPQGGAGHQRPRRLRRRAAGAHPPVVGPAGEGRGRASHHQPERRWPAPAVRCALRFATPGAGLGPGAATMRDRLRRQKAGVSGWRAAHPTHGALGTPHTAHSLHRVAPSCVCLQLHSDQPLGLSVPKCGGWRSLIEKAEAS